MLNTRGNTLLGRIGAVGTEDGQCIFDGLPGIIDVQRGIFDATLARPSRDVDRGARLTIPMNEEAFGTWVEGIVLVDPIANL